MKLIARLGLMLLVMGLMMSSVLAQDVLGGRDLSRVNVDALSNEELLRYRDQLQQSGLTEQQAEAIALQRGMPAAEIQKLRLRMSTLVATPASSATTPAHLALYGNAVACLVLKNRSNGYRVFLLQTDIVGWIVQYLANLEGNDFFGKIGTGTKKERSFGKCILA